MSLSHNLLATCDVPGWYRKLSAADQTRLKNSGNDVILVAVIDGFDAFAANYPTKAEEKRDLHHRLCHRHIEARQGRILPQAAEGPWFEDAVLAVFSNPLGLHRAIAAAVALGRAMTTWNLEHWQFDHGAVWEHQVHSRMAVTTDSWLDTLQLLQQARRGEILIPKTDLDQLRPEESLLLNAAAKVRNGVSLAAWAELEEEAADCFGLAPQSGSDVPRVVPASSAHR